MLYQKQYAAGNDYINEHITVETRKKPPDYVLIQTRRRQEMLQEVGKKKSITYI